MALQSVAWREGVVESGGMRRASGRRWGSQDGSGELDFAVLHARSDEMTRVGAWNPPVWREYYSGLGWRVSIIKWERWRFFGMAQGRRLGGLSIKNVESGVRHH